MVVDEKLLKNKDFVQAVYDYVNQGLLIPKPDNFTPSSRTPWGGHKIRELMQPLGIAATGDVIGEAWMLSAHKSFPNLFEIEFEGKVIDVPLWLMGQVVPEVMPRFLTKLLNSGSWLPFKEELKKNLEIAKQPEILDLNYHELHKALSTIECAKDLHQQMLTKNLSVQIHPDKAYCEQHPEKNWHSKTEAWVIIDAEEGAGLYLGLKEGITEDKMRKALEAGDDISEHLNFVPVKAGDTFFIPSGTPHAIGAGILLVEPQETSETTFRYYDWGRTDVSGKPRQLHVDDALAVTLWDTSRGQAFVKTLERKAQQKSVADKGNALCDNIVDEDEFILDRVHFNQGEAFEVKAMNSTQGLLVLKGAVNIYDEMNNKLLEVKQGQAFYVAKGVESYIFKASDQTSLIIAK
jgi:mannose-6-phosphate isomerase